MRSVHLCKLMSYEIFPDIEVEEHQFCQDTNTTGELDLLLTDIPTNTPQRDSPPDA